MTTFTLTVPEDVYLRWTNDFTQMMAPYLDDGDAAEVARVMRDEWVSVVEVVKGPRLESDYILGFRSQGALMKFRLTYL